MKIEVTPPAANLPEAFRFPEGENFYKTLLAFKRIPIKLGENVEPPEPIDKWETLADYYDSVYQTIKNIKQKYGDNVNLFDSTIGPNGAGKSTLEREVLYPMANRWAGILGFSGVVDLIWDAFYYRDLATGVYKPTPNRPTPSHVLTRLNEEYMENAGRIIQIPNRINIFESPGGINEKLVKTAGDIRLERSRDLMSGLTLQLAEPYMMGFLGRERHVMFANKGILPIGRALLGYISRQLLKNAKSPEEGNEIQQGFNQAQEFTTLDEVKLAAQGGDLGTTIYTVIQAVKFASRLRPDRSNPQYDEVKKNIEKLPPEMLIHIQQTAESTGLPEEFIYLYNYFMLNMSRTLISDFGYNSGFRSVLPEEKKSEIYDHTIVVGFDPQLTADPDWLKPRVKKLFKEVIPIVLKNTNGYDPFAQFGYPLPKLFG